LLVVGCHHNPIDNQLQLAESIMEEHPDSALTILQSIDGSTLTGETQALHALLLSQAYDKNYIDLTDDSLISIATNYYLSSSDAHHKMLAHYYRASVNYNAGYYETALMDALTALELTTDPISLARIESLNGRLYCRSKNYQESINWEQLSLYHNKMAGNTKWIPNNYINLGNNYIMMFQSKKALLYADSAQNIIGESDSRINEMRYYAYFFLNMDREADSLYKLMGEPEEFIRHQRIIHADEESLEARIELSDELTREQNEFFYEAQISSLPKIRTDYENSKRVFLQEKLRQSRHLFIALLIIGLLVISLLVAVILVFRLRARTIRLKTEHDFALLSQEYESLKYKLHSQESTSRQEDIYNLRRDVSLSFMQKFSWIEQVGNIYADASVVNGKKDNLIFKKVSSLINDVKNNDVSANIDCSIKESNPTLWEEINQIGMSESEKIIFYYLLCGVSTRVICILTDKTPAAIYNIKSRIKKKLKMNNSPTSIYFLSKI
ncbi:MAG: hypothetical protein K2M05_01325, partial [Paramuribaculum sp.]|nr:hypothetical protein [Paramuribaculum sp.]